jgi:inner membrane protein
LIGLVASALWRASRVPALVASGVLVSYVGLQFLLQQRAIQFGEQHAQASGLKEAMVSALPRPLSPFNWMVVITEPERYHYANVNLFSAKPPPPLPEKAGWMQRLAAPYLPLSDAQWIVEPRYGSRRVEPFARAAWNHPQFAFYRWFAGYPALFRVEFRDAVQCAWFQDLRFVTPGRSTVPFRYGMCRASTGKWQAFELHTNGRVSVVH